MDYAISDLALGERLIIHKEQIHQEGLPPYNLVGNGLTNRHGTSLDLVDVCVQLNLGELRLLQYVRNLFNQNCINKEIVPNVVEPNKGIDWCDYLKTVLKKNYSHLEYSRVLIRLTRGKYLLNPYLFMHTKSYSAVRALWDKRINELERIDNDGIPAQ